MKLQTRTISDLWENTLAELITAHVDKSRAGNVRRLQGYCARIEHPQCNILVNNVRKFSLKYGAGEFVWYLSPNPTIEQISHYAPSYKKFAEDNYAFYGGRINHTSGNQLIRVASTLRQDPSSRRAVLVLWQAPDLALQHRQDLPCTLTYKFNVCDGKLNMIADMRSNDAWLGMPNDIFVNTCIHILVCKLTGHDVGFYQHQVGDLHLYEKDWSKASHALEAATSSESTPIGSVCDWSRVVDLVRGEQCIRSDSSAVVVSSDPFFDFILKALS